MPYFHHIPVKLSCGFCDVRGHAFNVMTHETPEQLSQRITRLLSAESKPPRSKDGARRVCASKRARR